MAYCSQNVSNTKTQSQFVVHFMGYGSASFLNCLTALRFGILRESRHMQLLAAVVIAPLLYYTIIIRHKLQ